MEVIREIDEFRQACERAREDGPAGPGGFKVGFVPTMGYLHDGHSLLLRAARQACGTVAMSIFVNPLQFGPTEDLERYPRDLERDSAIAEREGVDLLFVPDVTEMYPDGEPVVTVNPGPIGEVLEGAIRPGHFTGVCKVVAKEYDIRTATDGAWYRCCGGKVRKLVDCCAYSRRRINGDAALTGYCYSGRKVFCVMYFQTKVPC